MALLGQQGALLASRSFSLAALVSGSLCGVNTKQAEAPLLINAHFAPALSVLIFIYLFSYLQL